MSRSQIGESPSNYDTIIDMTNPTQQTDRATTDRAADTPKRLGRRSAEESRATRRALLDAAVVVFAEKGMNGARLDEIAERAGVTKGAIYSHFGGREDLLVEACRSAIRSLQLMRLAEEASDLTTFMDESARRLLAPGGATARMLLSELHSSARRSELIADLVAEWHAGFVETVKDRVPPGAGSPEAVAMALNILHVGLSYADVYQSMPADPDEVLAIINRLTAALLLEARP